MITTIASNTFDKCSQCGEYGFSRSHRCAPSWHCQLLPVDDYDFSRQIYAYEQKEAAEKLVAQYENNCGEYSIANGESIDVLIYSWKDWQELEVSLEELEYQEEKLKTPDEYEADELDTIVKTLKI